MLEQVEQKNQEQKKPQKFKLISSTIWLILQPILNCEPITAFFRKL